MPNVDGYELIQTVRKLALQKNLREDIKAIALSGYAAEQDRQNSLAAGFDRHINKPMDVNNLIKVIAQLANADR